MVLPLCFCFSPSSYLYLHTFIGVMDEEGTIQTSFSGPATSKKGKGIKRKNIQKHPSHEAVLIPELLADLASSTNVQFHIFLFEL